MSDKKRLFVCEFITAGGLVGEEIPRSLIKEGSLMRDQLCYELSEFGQYELIGLHDARLSPAPHMTESLAVKASFDVAFADCLKHADCVWLIAPEFDDILLQLTQQCETAKVPVIGAGSHLVKLAADKLETASWLGEVNIDTPMTLSISAWQRLPHSVVSMHTWLAKPIKGVGGEGIISLSNIHAVQRWLANNTQADLSDYLLQMEVRGALPASLSLLCRDGDAYLLSCNRLIMAQTEDGMQLDKIIVNGFAEFWPSFERIAIQIANNLPNLRGYLGIDVMFVPQTGEISVLEINPRLSSSYVGLSEATGQNIAQCLLDAYYHSDFQLPTITRQPVTIQLS